jgi:hypothetical protein
MIRIFRNDIVRITNQCSGTTSHLLVRGFFVRHDIYFLKGFAFSYPEGTVDLNLLLQISTLEYDVQVLQEMQINGLISAENLLPTTEREIINTLQTQHQLKERSIREGLDVFAVHFTLFSDDTSANISKKWNKVDVVYLRLGSRISFFL